MGDNLLEFPRIGGTTNLDTQSFTSIYVIGIIQTTATLRNQYLKDFLEDHDPECHEVLVGGRNQIMSSSD